MPWSARAEAPAALPFACIYDTGVKSEKPLSAEAVAARSGWARLAEGDLIHPFKGDAVLVNGPLTVVFREKAPGPEVYAHTASGPKWRATLYECGEGIHAAKGLGAVRLLENNPGAAAAEAEFERHSGRTARVRFRLTVGQPWVEACPCGSGLVLVYEAEPHRLVISDFFGDDMVFPGLLSEGGTVALPAENCFLCLLDGSAAMIMCVWRSSVRPAEAVIGGVWPRLRVGGAAVFPAEEKPVWFAFLEAPGLWHERPVKFADEGTTVALDWKPPFPAKWRADLVRPDHTAQSWFFRGAEETDPLSAGSPCRLDGDRATVQIPPPAKPQPGVDPRVGPLLVYPLDRSRATPLTTFTPVDILRNTLGVGPCQYILESEGLASQEVATPDQVMTWVEKQFRKKGGKEAADEIKERLKAMTDHVGRARARLTKYRDFAASAGALVRVMGTSLEASRLADEASFTFARLAQAAEEGLAATDAARLAKLADEVAALIGRDDAAVQVARPAAEIRAVGHALDRALARSRMAVRWLREQVAAADLTDDREAEKARQVRALAEQILQGK